MISETLRAFSETLSTFSETLRVRVSNAPPSVRRTLSSASDRPEHDIRHPPSPGGAHTKGASLCRSGGAPFCCATRTPAPRWNAKRAKAGRPQIATPMVFNNTEKRNAEGVLDELRTLLRGVREEVHELRDEIRELRTERDDDALLTRAEAADRLRISTRTLDDMASEGEIQPIRVRGRVLYHPDALDAFVRRSSRGGRS